MDTNTPDTTDAVQHMRMVQNQLYGDAFSNLVTDSHAEVAHPMIQHATTITPADVMPQTPADHEASLMSHAPPLDLNMSMTSGSQQNHSAAELSPVSNHGMSIDYTAPVATGCGDVGDSIPVAHGLTAGLPVRGGTNERVSTEEDDDDDDDDDDNDGVVLKADGNHDDNDNDNDNDDDDDDNDDDDPDIGVSMPSSLAPAGSRTRADYFVTIPFHNSRGSYYATVCDEYKQALGEIDDLSMIDGQIVADAVLLETIDSLSLKLQEICDLPDMLSNLVDHFPPHTQMKHAVQSNSKFAFLHSLLAKLRGCRIRIMIICREGPVHTLLGALLKTSGYNYKMFGGEQGMDGSHLGEPTLFLVGSSQDIDFSLARPIDCVVLFDSSCLKSRVAALARQMRRRDGRPPLVLTLCMTNSLEHIYWSLPPLDRRDQVFNKLMIAYGLYECLPLVRDPPEGYVDPLELATMFAPLLEGTSNALSWWPIDLPERVIETFATAQANRMHQLHGTSRKRPIDTASQDRQKRPKLSHCDYRSPSILESYVESRELRAQVVKLTKLTESKEIELEAARKSEEQVRLSCERLRLDLASTRKTMSDTTNTFLNALTDRGKADAECRRLKHELSDALKEVTRSKSRISDLENTLKQRDEQLRIARNEMATPDAVKLLELQEALEATQLQLETTKTDMAKLQSELDFTRSRYQTESTLHSDLKNKVTAKDEELLYLRHKASNTLKEIHEENNRSMIGELQKVIREKNFILSSRMETIRKLEEQIARGLPRRETRQSAVAKSPLITTSHSGEFAGLGSAGRASRGASPAASVASSATAGSIMAGSSGSTHGTHNASGGMLARFGHLRD